MTKTKSIIIWERSGFVSPFWNSVLCPHSVVQECTNECFENEEE